MSQSKLKGYQAVIKEHLNTPRAHYKTIAKRAGVGKSTAHKVISEFKSDCFVLHTDENGRVMHDKTERVGYIYTSDKELRKPKAPVRRRKPSKPSPQEFRSKADDDMSTFLMGVTCGVTLTSVVGFIAWSMQ